MKKAGKTKKQIILKNSAVVKQRFSTQATTTTKPSAKIKKTREEQKMFFGLDLHKKFLQVVAVDQERNLLMNKRVENDFKIIEQKFPAFPKNAKYVLGSSSVRYGVY